MEVGCFISDQQVILLDLSKFCLQGSQNYLTSIFRPQDYDILSGSGDDV